MGDVAMSQFDQMAHGAADGGTVVQVHRRQVGVRFDRADSDCGQADLSPVPA